MRRPLNIVVATWTLTLLLAGTASAEPRYSQELDSYTLGRAKTELRDLAKREGIEAETADLLLKIDVFATSNDTGCPGVDVDIINATKRTIWNVEAKVEQKEGTKDRKDLIHLPYMLANTKVRITVDCLQDYSYRSRYDYSGGGGISLNYSAQGSKTLDDALPLMLEQRVDYLPLGSSISPSAEGRGTLLAAALEMDDPAVAKELVQGIARTGVGRKELGDAIADNGTGAIADEVVTAMSKLPPAQQAQLARTLLASEVALRWKDKLMPMIDRQLCVGNRAEVVGLWIQAQGSDGIPVEEFRARISDKCKPTKADGPGITAALEKEPKRAGATLDAVDDELFASAVAAWAKVRAPATSESLMAYLQDGQKPERFDAAVKTVGAHSMAAAIEAIIGSPEGPAATHKAEWIVAAFAKLPPEELDLNVTTVTRAMVSGGVRSSPMRDAIKGLAKLAPKAAEDVMVTQANQHSKVFDAEKLQSAGLDMAEFLAFNANLPDCTATIETLTDCADKIATYKDKSGEGALKKQAKLAVKPEFLTSVRELTTKVSSPKDLIPVAGALGAAGFDTGFIADRACRDAEDAVRFDGSPDAALELAAKISPDAPCITAVNDKIKGKARKAVMMGILGILCLIVPIVVGGFLVKRRWKKLQKDLPPEAKEDVQAGMKLDDRLGPSGLGRQLSGAIADASRELAGSPAAHSLSALDDSVINAASATVRRAVKSADAATLLIKRPAGEGPYRNAAGEAVYVVVLPVRHARPQVVQRYLSAPWPEHLAQIQKAAGMPVLALVILCGPDAAEASLLVGYSDGARISDPEALLDAKEARDRGANKFRSVMTLATSAAIPAPVTKAA
ncbi:MAG: hypothetical protein IPQ07_19515 [Myxococcales bacterium]|nr:hypothetical protein [Myxococcales bacterium]